jgi:general secretion pathway protein H
MNPAPRRRLAGGFTLVELLVVLVIVGILLGVVSINAMPSERQTLEREAQRIALLLQLARDEAIVRNRPLALEVEPDRYRFLVREDGQWRAVGDDDLLRERNFKRAPLAFTLDPPVAQASGPLRIVFGREPVDKPFVLTLLAGNERVAIRADGIGHYTVE